MPIDRIFLKQRANECIAAAKPSAYAVTLVYLIVCYIIGYISNTLNNRVSIWLDNWMQGVTEAYIPPLEFNNTILMSDVFIMLLSLMSSVLAIGFAAYCLKLSRMETAGFNNLMDGFSYFGKSLLLIVLMRVFTFLWSLLFFFPGIVASYRYRQAYYIMLDYPELSAMECIRRSKRLMYGHKMELFVLDLSFLGWIILGAMTMGILYIWKMPYFGATYSNYYLALSGNQLNEAPPRSDDEEPWGQL